MCLVSLGNSKSVFARDYCILTMPHIINLRYLVSVVFHFPLYESEIAHLNAAECLLWHSSLHCRAHITAVTGITVWPNMLQQK